MFEELEPQHQLEFIEDKRDEEIADVLGPMETDDAADLLAALPEERREDVVRLLPPVQRRRIRALLGYDPATAGGLMTPEFVCVYRTATEAEGIDRVAVVVFGRFARLDLRDERALPARRRDRARRPVRADAAIRSARCRSAAESVNAEPSSRRSLG